MDRTEIADKIGSMIRLQTGKRDRFKETITFDEMGYGFPDLEDLAMEIEHEFGLEKTPKVAGWNTMKDAVDYVDAALKVE